MGRDRGGGTPVNRNTLVEKLYDSRKRMLDEMDKNLPNMIVISAMANACREIREMIKEASNA